MEQRLVSPETLVTQGLGGVGQGHGRHHAGDHPVRRTTSKSPTAPYHQDRVYARADNPTYEHAERLLATLEDGG